MLTWLEISKKELIHNIKQFRKIVGQDVKLMAVVKSNAYGHGMVECAKIFEKNGADYLGVINLEEALELRKNGLKKPIFILSYWTISTTNEIKQGILKNVEFCVYTEEQIKILAKISQKIGRKAKIHIKIDTGTSRIGILPENALNFTKKCLKSPWLEVKGVYTHFAKSEAENQAFTNKQAKKMIEIKGKLMAINGFSKNVIFHAGCTASTLNNPNTYFDMVRIGLGLYGLWPSKETRVKNKRVILKPAITWETKIIQIKELPKETFVGYDCTYQCKRKIKIAVLPIGYWDGYDRKLSNPTPLKLRGTKGCGEVIIRGRRVSIIGRVCMNLMMVDISKIKNIRLGDEVILLGDKITVEELAKKVGTINYEIITRINSQIIRIYK
jgi:alanine racemase